MHRPYGPHRSPRRPASILRAIVPPLATLACLSGCGGEPGSETGRSVGQDAAPADPGPRQEERAIVAVSILPIAGIVDALLPPGVASISVLVPAGASPHSFEPGIGQLKQVQSARMVLEVGHPALVWERGWLEGLLSGTDAVRVRLSEGCDVIEDDPHVWLDPACLQIMAERAADALVTAFPDRSVEIRTRLDSLGAAIRDAEAEIRDRLADRQGRSFLVQHPAWGYFGRAFGVEQVSILTHGSSDRGSARLAAVIDRAKRENLHIVIVQPQVNPEAARVVAREIGAEIRQVDPMARSPLESLESITLAVLDATAP
jgi:zinc transport system substrate-binding protein